MKFRMGDDLRKCVRCGSTDKIEEHHLIPKTLWRMVGMDDSSDKYRILLCSGCHSKITDEWEILFEKMRSADFIDGLIEREYGIGTMNVVWETQCGETEAYIMPSWLGSMIERGCVEGSRHTKRFIIISNMHKRGFSTDEIKKAVYEFNDNCTPSEDHRAVEYHIKNTMRVLER